MGLDIINRVIMTTWGAPGERFWFFGAAALAACMLALIGLRSISDPLWSDEFLTTSLLQANSLPKLWAGIALGIDGNPPLYLTLLWVVLHGLPQAVSTVVLLKVINVGFAAGGVAVLYLLARRLASPAACWVGVMMIVTLGEAFTYVASELRTYALYFLAASLAALLQQRLIEDRCTLNLTLLAAVNIGLSMSHTFGIVYVGIIAFAGWLSEPRDGRLLRAIIVAVIPSIIAVLAWSPVLLGQLQVAKPYTWIMPPSLSDLSETLFRSNAVMWIAIFESACLLSILAPEKSRHPVQFRNVIIEHRWQPARFIALLLFGFTSFTLYAWLFSRLVFPLFVPRFFTPQILVTFALHVAFGAWLLSKLESRRGIIATLGILIVSLNVLMHNSVSMHRQPICVNEQGGYFESSQVHGDLAVISDSPHIFLPRATYGVHSEAYRFPLDWDVVLKYPDQSRGNAVDYHIMNGLRTWMPMTQVMSTEEILRKNPQFLVVEMPLRSWFRNLRATHDVVAEKLAEVKLSGAEDVSCTLWRVTRVSPRTPLRTEQMSKLSPVL
jgi:hypothetical protein